MTDKTGGRILRRKTSQPKMLLPSKVLARASKHSSPPRVTDYFRLTEQCPHCNERLIYFRQYDKGKFTRAYVECAHCKKFSQLRPGTLDPKTVFEEKRPLSYRLYPTGGKTLDAMFDAGVFATNPKNGAGSPPASLYFEADECRDYWAKNPGAKVWTVVEYGDNWYMTEGFHFVNRLAHMIEMAGKWDTLKAQKRVIARKPQIIRFQQKERTNAKLPKGRQ